MADTHLMLATQVVPEGVELSNILLEQIGGRQVTAAAIPHFIANLHWRGHSVSDSVSGSMKLNVANRFPGSWR